MIRDRAWILTLALLSAPTGVACGQSVAGTLSDQGSRTPVPGATVELLDDRGSVSATARTDEDGAYRIRAPGQGAYWLRVQALGYQPVESRPFVLARGDSLVLDLATVRSVATLEGVTVLAPSRTTRTYAGFLERQRFGFGRYRGPEELIQRRPIFVSSVISGMAPGVAVTDGAVGWTSRGRSCAPTLWVDGHQVVGDPEDTRLDSVVRASMVRAIEVYTDPSMFPAEVVGLRGGCGAILIWTVDAVGDGGAS